MHSQFVMNQQTYFTNLKKKTLPLPNLQSPTIDEIIYVSSDFYPCCEQSIQLKKQGVHHTVACLPFTLESILMQKKNYENSNISPCKNIIFKKKSSKRNQDPSRYHNSTTNLKCQPKPKISSFKNPGIKIDLLPKGQSPLLLSYILIMNLNTISLPTKARPIKLDLFNNENLHTFSHK